MTKISPNANILYSDYQATLADTAEIDSGWLDMEVYDKVQFSGYSDTAGLTMTIESKVNDDGGTPTQLTTPVTYTDGNFYMFNVICRQRFMRFYWTNNTGGVVNDASMEIKAFIGSSDKLSVLPVGVQPTDFSQAGLVQSIIRGQQPDGDYVSIKADGQFFNTSSNLAADATYTSSWFDHDGFGTLEYFFSADVPSANKGILIEWTDDANVGSPTVLASDYYEFNASDVRRGYRELHIRPKLDGFRISYTNGSEAQSSVYISATGRVNPEIGIENSGGATIVGSFEREVSLGNISNYGQNTKFGRNPEVDTGTPADIWGGGRNALGVYNYTGFNATANENIATVSSSTSDVGAVRASGTVTTTGATTIIDSSATFITSSVAVGDIVLNDSRGTYGYVKSIDSETQLTVYTMQDTVIGEFANITGNTYRIAYATSTGAVVVVWRRILNADLERQTNVFVVLNGTTTVNTTVDAYRLSRGKVLLAGSSGNNVGEITCNQATTTANIFCVMPATSNQTLICADTVPKDTVYLLESVSCALSVSGGSAASGVVSLRVRPRGGGVFNTQRIYDLSSQGGAYVDKEEGGIAIGGGTDFKLRVDSVSSNNTRLSGKIEYLEIDEV